MTADTVGHKPGTLEAETCTRGRGLRDYCGEHQLPYDECGKLVVVVDDDERARLDAPRRTATADQVPGQRSLKRAQIRHVEPLAVELPAAHRTWAAHRLRAATDTFFLPRDGALMPLGRSIDDSLGLAPRVAVAVGDRRT
jgi:L-2-hydroxyglutarate oxidase LhgO